MKTLVRSLLAFSASALFLAQANASVLNCADIEKADREGTIAKKPFESEIFSAFKLQIELLRKAVVLSESATASEVAAMTADELSEQFDPIFKNIVIGQDVFHAVDLSLGDNPYVYLFDVKKGEYTDIMSADGSIMVGRDYCETTNDIF